MPPKSKFTKDEIVAAALHIVMASGAEALTARSLGDSLGSSARPIFTIFDSMDEVKKEVVTDAYGLYEKYVDECMGEDNSFKGSGIGYVRFALEQPKLFRLLFMSERIGNSNPETTLKHIDRYYEKILQSVQASYGFGYETSKEIYMHMWIYTHGIAALIATNVCRFSEEEISDKLTDVCSSVIRKYKTEGRV